MLAQAAVLTGTATAAFSGGSGTSDDPYQIRTADDWMELAKTEHHWGAGRHFVLVADLDFAGGAVPPVGNHWNPFSGVFDGAGHVMRNGQIDLPGEEHVGLFRCVAAEGVVRNLGTVNLDVQGLGHVGGAVGLNLGTVTSSYATGVVRGENAVGGVAGRNYGMVLDSYATGSVKGGQNAGGLVGYSSSGTVSDSYWNIETSGQSSSAGGEGRTTDEMTYPYAENTYVKWDFTGVWAADVDYSENCGYPHLIANVPPGHSGCMPPAEGEGEPPVEGDGEPPVEGEGEPPVEGEGEPPGLIIIPTGPLHVVKTVGDSVTFEVQVSGTSEPIYYQWKHHRSEKTFEAIIGANESAYTIASIVAEDAGEYLCEVTVGAEIQYSDIFVLTVDAGLAAHGWIGLGVCAGVTALAGMLAARQRSKRSFSERSG